MIMKNRLSDDAFRNKESTSETRGGALGSATGYFDTVEEAIAQHPGLSLAAALLFGVALAWWIKRR